MGYVDCECIGYSECVSCIDVDGCGFCEHQDDLKENETIIQVCFEKDKKNTEYCSDSLDGIWKERKISCYQSDIDPYFKGLLAILIFLLVLGMGSTVDFNDLLHIFKRPLPFLVGFCSQYLYMPLIAFFLSFILRLTDYEAIGFILLGCTPGGSTSNLFSYFSKGDVTLSICMTVVSTIFSFVMLPLLVWIYTIPFRSGEGISIPFLQILLGLLLVTVPAILGIIVKNTLPKKVSKTIEMVGVGGGVFSIIAAIAFGSLIYEQLYAQSIKIWLASAVLPYLGCTFGFLGGKLLRRTPGQQRTISLEVGIQNSSLTITIIALSFKRPEVIEVLRIPMLYSIWLFIAGITVSLFFRFVILRYVDKESTDSDSDTSLSQLEGEDAKEAKEKVGREEGGEEEEGEGEEERK